MFIYMYVYIYIYIYTIARSSEVGEILTVVPAGCSDTTWCVERGFCA